MSTANLYNPAQPGDAAAHHDEAHHHSSGQQHNPTEGVSKMQTNQTPAKQYGVYATCRSPRAEVLKTAQGYLSQVKVTARGWMQSACYIDPETALAACRGYIREESRGRVDPYKALKIIWK